MFFFATCGTRSWRNFYSLRSTSYSVTVDITRLLTAHIERTEIALVVEKSLCLCTHTRIPDWINCGSIIYSPWPYAQSVFHSDLVICHACFWKLRNLISKKLNKECNLLAVYWKEILMPALRSSGSRARQGAPNLKKLISINTSSRGK